MSGGRDRRPTQRRVPRAQHPALGLAIVCAGALLGPLDTSVNVAFPAITAAFGLALAEIQWVVVPFVLAQSVLTIAFGRLGDLYGHRRVFAVGMAACALTHLAAGFAPDFGWLVALRVLQGIAVGLAVSCAPALATLLFPPQEKRRILGVYVTLFSLGLAMGPLAGGALVGWLGWPGVFWFRVPIALGVLLLLPLLADVRASDVAASDAVRLEAAIPRISPLRTPRFAGVQLASTVVNLACFSILLLIPYALAARPGNSIEAAGALLSLFPGGSLLGGVAGGRLTHRASATGLMLAGLATAGTGLLLTAASVTTYGPLPLGAALALTGFGLGLFQVGYMDATTSMLPASERGVAGSLVTVTRSLGIVLGATGISALHTALGSLPWTIATMGAALLAFTGAALLGRRAGR